MSATDSKAPRPQSDVEQIRLRGSVQGAGVRPTVARLARERGLCGWVKNDSEGVLILIRGPRALRDVFVRELTRRMPPLARVVALERTSSSLPAGLCQGFFIVESDASPGAALPRTAILPDAAICALCLVEVRDHRARRSRYPFTNCTHCGPRFTIVKQIPYDRSRTTMAGFALCEACKSEYDDEEDRRYHAEPIACPQCGPRVTLSPLPEAEGLSGDELQIASTLLKKGEILAIKGLGGYHLCCDATSEAAVALLRLKKCRPSKPFALMARDVEMVRQYCSLRPAERDVLTSPAAPIVLLDRCIPIVKEQRSRRSSTTVVPPIAPSVAPGHATLGMMLPFTPLHHLLMERMESPIVCTSGNLSEDPICIDAVEARARLSNVATFFLDHDRPIAHRIDDSVVRVSAGALRVIRRARGYAPAPLLLPPGFEDARSVLAMGGQWKNTLCFLGHGQAIVSPHLGDLDSAMAFREWRRARAELGALFEHDPAVIAVDAHPNYASTQDGQALARERDIPVAIVQHHHAHIAACLAEHGVLLGSPKVLGIALDGIGYGSDGTLWGGEFLLTDYASFERAATFKPVALIGGDLAAREPWRNLYAHLLSRMSWSELASEYSDLPCVQLLWEKPRSLLDRVMEVGTFAPCASSCGRLFDAVAAAVGLYPERVDYEGQAAIALEQTITQGALDEAKARSGYPFDVRILPSSGLPAIDAWPCFRALLDDLRAQAGIPLMSARFHLGLAEIIAEMTRRIRERSLFDTVALSGGVWQNSVLLGLVSQALREGGYRVLIPEAFPVNDGCIALGQAVIAALSTPMPTP